MFDSFSSIFSTLRIISKGNGEFTARVVPVCMWILTVATAAYHFAVGVTLFARECRLGWIQCLSRGGIDKDAFNAYCWHEGVLTSFGSSSRNIYAGIGLNNANDRRQHLYVEPSYVFLFAAPFMILPMALWKYVCEGGKAAAMQRILCKELSAISPSNETDRNAKIEEATFTFRKFLKSSGVYYTYYVFCNVSALGCNFLLYAAISFYLNFEFGLPFQSYKVEEDTVFPVKVSCRLSTVGPSGGFMHQDTLCVLPLSYDYRLVFYAEKFVVDICLGYGILATLWDILGSFTLFLAILCTKFCCRKKTLDKRILFARKYGFTGTFMLKLLEKNLPCATYDKFLTAFNANYCARA